MMFKKIRKGLKGVKQFMETKVELCKEVLSDTRNKLMIGLAFMGIGAAVVASIYVPIPN